MSYREEILAEALALAAAGVPVFAVSPSKVPYWGSHGHLDATTDEPTIREMFRAHPYSLLATPTGPAVRRLVVDVDPRHGGDDALASLEDEHGRLPKTFTVNSPGRDGWGGFHLHFVHPGPQFRIKSTTSHPRLGRGIDIKADGGSIIMPPSVRDDGGQYRPQIPTLEMARIPGWFADLIIELPPPAPLPCPTSIVSGAYAAKAIHENVAAILAAREGHRQDTLNTMAFNLGTLASTGVCTVADFRDRVVCAGLATGLPQREVLATVEHAIRDGLRKGRAEISPRSAR